MYVCILEFNKFVFVNDSIIFFNFYEQSKTLRAQKMHFHFNIFLKKKNTKYKSH